MDTKVCFDVTEDYDGMRLDAYLASVFDGKSRSFLQKLIKEGKVFVNGLTAKKSSLLVETFDAVEIHVPEAESLNILPEALDVEVLYEDEDVLVVNKPKGMVVHPSAGHLTGTLVNFVMYHCAGNLSGINGVMRPGIVHRIDMDTTGSLIICKNDIAHVNISEQIKAHSCDRIYLGIVLGSFKELEGDIESTIGRDPKDRKKMAMNVPGGKDASTHYRVLASNDKYSLVEFKLKTGRTHQIRVHMNGNNHPLLGDMTYGGARAIDKRHLKGQTLHAYQICFTHPTTGERICVKAPLPEYFIKLCDEFGFSI